MKNEQVVYQGASFLLFFKGYFIFGVKDLKSIDNKTYAYLTGIGGKMESGETFQQCAIRESMEEIGSTPKILSTPKTFILKNMDITEVDAFPENPLFVVERIAPQSSIKLIVYVFAALLEQDPVFIEDEFDDLILFPPKCLIGIHEKDLTLNESITKGTKRLTRNKKMN